MVAVRKFAAAVAEKAPSCIDAPGPHGTRDTAASTPGRDRTCKPLASEASGFAICTRYAQDKPVVTYEIRGGKVLATWAHDSTAGPPNAGIAAKFKSAESEHAELMKKVLPERRKLVAKWVDQVREVNRRALGPVKRDEAIKRDEINRQKSNKAHQFDRLRHERMQGRP